MYLMSLFYKSNSNALKTYDFNFYTDRIHSNKVEPICLVGLNGSGKSKLIEIIAEIFFVLDANRQMKHSTADQKACKSDFRMTYQIGIIPKEKIVKIKGRFRQTPEVTVNDELLSVEHYGDILPKHIVGYSSGHNETISPKFFTLRKNDLARMRKSIEDDKSENLDLTRTLFLDRNTSILLLITIFVFNQVKGKLNPFIKKINKHLKLDSISTFQILITNLKGTIRFSRKMEEIILKLEKCSLLDETSIEDNNRSYRFEFFLNDVSRKAFVDQFKTPQDLFNDLYGLHSLNLLDDSQKNSIFRISEEEIKVTLSEPQVEATYKDMSDGEHQFIQIFGSSYIFANDNSIFLFDEPESHFNPVWRAKFVNILNEILEDDLNAAEFLLSTHSPYIVSACKRENVFKFNRTQDGIIHEFLEDQTFGASFDVLLEMLFDMKGLVSELAKRKMKELVRSEIPREKKIEKLENEFGDSYEKRLLINMLNKGLLDAVSS